MRIRVPRLGALLLLILGSVQAAVRWNDLLKQPADWYAGTEARAIAASILQYQTPEGGWPKNTDMTQPPSAEFLADTRFDHRAPTIDNNATTTQLAFLARMLTAQDDAAWRAAFDRGFAYLIAAQYPNGGWAQYYPQREGYYTHITYNDNAMVNVLTVLRGVSRGAAPYAFPTEKQRAQASAAVKLGIECILRTQVRRDGHLTAWCAQHDETTFAPAWARNFEPPSLSGSESVGIVEFLMGEEQPDPRIIAAVEGAVAWLNAVPIHGLRVDESPGADGKRDRHAIADPAAPALWARFYELGTDRPIFTGRDKVIRYDFNEIERERRTGYGYLGTWPATLITKDYPRWRARIASIMPVPSKPDVIVAADGSGQYASLQEAIGAAPLKTDPAMPRWVIFVKAGTYRERVYVQRERGNIHVIGEDRDKTVIVYNQHANLPGPDGKIIGTFRTPTVQVDGDGMIWENLTIANDAGLPGPRPDGPPVVQALALRADGDRLEFRHCRFLGWQDTILVNRGRHYFVDCYIEGHVDFIFGAATAYFDRCHIHVLKDGYITAASTPKEASYGLVFADCRITGAEGVKTYLGRPWRDFARTVFLRTEMSDAVRPEGWHNWNKPQAEQTTFYAEFGSTGPGASPTTRVPWAKPLTAEEAGALTPAKVLGGIDGWSPSIP
jgi:pectinesterase